MRSLHVAVLVVTASACGVSTLEMSDAERGLGSAQSAPSSVTKQDAGWVPPAEELDAGSPNTAEDGGAPQVDAGRPILDAGTPVVDAGVPVECETGATTPCTANCASTGRKSCVNNHWGTCQPPAEACDNGRDDDCDGRVDHHDTDCTPIVHTCESADGPGCNGDLGSGNACSPADNQNGCSATRFHAWCNRRNASFPNIWDNYVHDWVSTRCDGNTDETGTQYSTWYCVSSSNDRYECTTPLVLSFDDAPVTFESSSRLFSFTPGSPVQSDWPAAVTPWLARDVNGNGRIDDGSELFGSNTQTPAGTARHGFEALSALDENGDGVIDLKDPQFQSLLVWRDANGDRVSQPDELTSLCRQRIDSISLGFTVKPRCDLRGNCARERSTFSWHAVNGAARQGSVVDVYLRIGIKPVATR